jgi:hypothetical protein
MARLWNATWPEGFAVTVIREVTGERKLKRSRRKSTKMGNIFGDIKILNLY